MDFAKARETMVDRQIRTFDVTDHRVISAFLSVPREAFVPEQGREFAYLDEDISLAPLGKQTRYLMEPAAFARMVQSADVKQDDVVLVVGAGTGYASAVLSVLSSSVMGIEEDEELAHFADQALAGNRYDNVALLRREMKEGCLEEAPYDVILMNGAVEELPANIPAQLAEGGRLVYVHGRGKAAEAKLMKRSAGVLSEQFIINCAVPLLPGFEADREFLF